MGNTRNLTLKDGFGHLEVAVHSPRLPFGSIHTEKLFPVIQQDGIYGIDSNVQTITESGTGTVTGASNLLTCATGATQFSFSTLQSKQRLRYRPGQGVVGRFTALFSTPVADSILVAGYGTAESGVYFGYNGTDFGILYNTDGVREIQTLTVTTAATTASDVTITLNGTGYTAAVTNAGGDATLTAYEIAQGTYTGWTAEQQGDTVVFLKSSAGDGGTVSFSAGTTGSAGSFAETLTGVNATDTWIPQSTWNGDRLDGTGSSGATLDPTKGNVFQIDIQYLGFGSITFMVEIASSGNNPDFVACHTIQYPNTSTAVSIIQPSFPFTMSAYSAGSTTDVSVSTASYAGFIEGDSVLNGPRLSYTGTKSTTTAIQAIGTIRNNFVYKGRANQSLINVLDLNFTARSANNTYTTLFIYKNATLSGTPEFTQYTTSSCSYIDVAATTAAITDNVQLIWSASIMELGTIEHVFPDDIILQPGETLTFAVQTSSGTGFATVSMNTREDH